MKEKQSSGWTYVFHENLVIELGDGFFFAHGNKPDAEYTIPLRAVPKPQGITVKTRWSPRMKAYKQFRDNFTLILQAQGLILPLQGRYKWVATCYYPDKRIPDKDNVEKAINDILFKQDKFSEGWVIRRVEKGVEPYIELLLWEIKGE